jgi:hypothetical protein
VLVTDLRHFEGIELDPGVPAPALRLATHLRRIVRAATVFAGRGIQPTALPCRRRPGRVPCPGRLRVERQDLPSRILWECPACDEAGVIDGWQGSLDDLSVLSESDEGGGLVQVVIPEKAYQLLLDEIALGQGCERLLYRARPRPEGVELSGNEDDFEQLIGVVAFQANHSATRARQRRWRAICNCLRPPARSWLENSTDVVIDELASFGLVSLRVHVTELIRDRLATVMKALDITEQSARRYLEEEDLRELAREAAVKLADEQPGANLYEQPRTIPASLQTIGRNIAALAEAAQVRVLNADTVGAHGALQLMSLLGQFLREIPAEPSGPVLLPQAMLTRSARLLEATAQMVREGFVVSPDIPVDDVAALAEAFARDAGMLRALVGGSAAGPSPAS